IADALAMLLLALRVRTEGGPEGDVTPLATLHETPESFRPSLAVHGAWSRDQVAPCPGHCGGLLHSSPPSPLRAGAHLPADPLGLHVPRGRGTQDDKGPRRCVSLSLHRGRAIKVVSGLGIPMPWEVESPFLIERAHSERVRHRATCLPGYPTVCLRG